MADDSINVLPSLLAGRVIQQIRLGLYQLQLCFDDGSHLAIESHLTCSRGGRRINWSPTDENRYSIPPLLGQRIVAADVAPDGGLLLSLSSGDGCEVRVRGNDPYESYQYVKDRLVVVV